MKCSLLIRPAMGNGMGRAADHLRVEGPMFMSESCYAAHKLLVYRAGRAGLDDNGVWPSLS